ncbi:outer membrane lipid asymmetry maintenance protein [Candidatus Hepatincola sp. Av]
MKHRTLEIVVGCCSIVVIAIFVTYVIANLYTNNSGQYKVYAKFNNIGSLSKGSALTMRGVKIGKVNDINLDPITFEVLLDIIVNDEVPIPEDSVLAIESAGVFSSPALTVTPGQSKVVLKNNSNITNTKDWVSLEDKLGNIFLNGKH